jgi:Mrp family chromosome partitioning ATPase
VTDAVVLSPEADRVILVARAGKTSKLALRRACDLLLRVNARVMGIVLNAIDVRSGHGYYYTYGGPDADRYYDEASSQDETTIASRVS